MFNFCKQNPRCPVQFYKEYSRHRYSQYLVHAGVPTSHVMQISGPKIYNLWTITALLIWNNRNFFDVATGKDETRVNDKVNKNSSVGYFNISDAFDDILIGNALGEIKNLQNFKMPQFYPRKLYPSFKKRQLQST